MDNTVKIRLKPDLLEYYKGKPDKHRRALELYKLAEEGVLDKYMEVKDEENAM